MPAPWSSGDPDLEEERSGEGPGTSHQGLNHDRHPPGPDHEVDVQQGGDLQGCGGHVPPAGHPFPRVPSAWGPDTAW